MPGEGVVLVTGGTGAIGVPVVGALAHDGAPVAVLTRTGVSDLGVRVVRGDILAGDGLGMDPVDAAGLSAQITGIVHAAALTSFDAPIAQLRDVNVEGTRNVLAFARRCPRLARLCVLSTVYVAGRRTGTIAETELEHDQGFVNPYEQSKYEAERLLRSAMADLPIAVVRLSTVIGDSVTGRVARPAAIHHAIRFLYQSLLPMIPGTPDSRVDLIPTDYAVAAVRHLAGSGFEAGRTFQVCAGDEAPGESELVDLVMDAFLRYRPAWRRRRIEKPAIVGLETFELFRRSVDAVADSALRASVAVLAPFAPQLAYAKVFDDTQCLDRLKAAGIARPPIRGTIERVVQYLVEHNWGGMATGGGAVA